MENDAAITIRVPAELRDKFNLTCKKRNTDASKALRLVIENFCTAVERGQFESSFVPSAEPGGETS